MAKKTRKSTKGTAPQVEDDAAQGHGPHQQPRKKK
jgi:hypothetical protein